MAGRSLGTERALSDDGMWRWSDEGWVPAALPSPDRTWVWSGLEWFRLPAPGNGPWRAPGWVALGLAFFSVYAVMTMGLGIADAQVAGVGTGVEELVMLAFILPGAVFGSVVAGRSWKSDVTARGSDLRPWASRWGRARSLPSSCLRNREG